MNAKVPETTLILANGDTFRVTCVRLELGVFLATGENKLPTIFMTDDEFEKFSKGVVTVLPPPEYNRQMIA